MVQETYCACKGERTLLMDLPRIIVNIIVNTGNGSKYMKLGKLS